MSKQYENDLAKKIHRQTPSRIRAYRCGYSGNNAMPQPDVLLTDVALNHGLEIKGPIQSDKVYVGADDIAQLRECQNGYTAVYLVIKFSRREPLVVRFFEELSGGQAQIDGAEAYNDMDPAEKLAALVPSAFNPRVTDSGTLALDKPSTDDWPSASSGSSDVDAILSGLGIATEKSVEVA